jgi:hypothetical protein
MLHYLPPRGYRVPSSRLKVCRGRLHEIAADTSHSGVVVKKGKFTTAEESAAKTAVNVYRQVCAAQTGRGGTDSSTDAQHDRS